MIKILTETQKEYEEIIKLVEGNKEVFQGSFIQIHKPKDSIASVVWSIDDVRSHFPQGTSDEIIQEGFEEIEKSMKESMISIGWETINVLKDDMLQVLDTEK